MTGRRWACAAVGLWALVAPAPARAQVAGIGVIPDGVFLPVTPAVTADRRYVRLTLAPQFSAFDGFQSFPVPAAVGGGGGGAVGFGAGAGGLGGGLGAGGGFNNGAGGLFGPGAPAAMNGAGDFRSASASPFASSFSRFLDDPTTGPSPARSKAPGAGAKRLSKRAVRPATLPARPAADPG